MNSNREFGWIDLSRRMATSPPLTPQPFPDTNSPMNIKDLSTDQIQNIIVIKKEIEKMQTRFQKRVEKLQAKIDSIAGDGGAPSPLTRRKKRRMSRAGRAAIAAAARARWAKIRGKGGKKAKPVAKKKDRRSSPAVRAKIAAAAKARWARAKAAGKTTL